MVNKRKLNQYFDSKEMEKVLVEWNDTQSDFPQDSSIHQLFEAQVERTPDAVAAIFEDSLLTYRELNHRSNQLAYQLLAFGVEPEMRVGLCVERSLEMLVGLLGILKVGGAYVPLDPFYPEKRLAFMIEDAKISVLLTQAKLLESTPKHNARVVCLDDCLTRDAHALKHGENPNCTLTKDNLAYVIYTSGSTGNPKGVLGLHRGAVNRFHWMWETFPFDSEEICCQKTSLSFVDSVWEIFGPLLKGIPIVIIPDAAVKDPKQFVQILAIQEVTRLVLVPSLLRVLLNTYHDLQSRLPKLKYWTTSGETLCVELFQRFQQALPDSILLNLYGSSEVSADATYWFSDGNSKSLQRIPIGRPIANTQIYILDQSLKPVPVGDAGELYISGVGLARGYFNRPNLTAEKFILHPFNAHPGSHLYKTGDLGRYLTDGNIEFLGRLDRQVKIRGFRIELEEIEVALSQNYSVSEAIVISWKDEPDYQYLVAYVVPRENHSEGSNEELEATPSKLRSFLKHKLPEYMIPNIFILLDALPLTPNGKVDRQALPKPEKNIWDIGTEFVTPRNRIEELLANIWAETLKLKQVGIHNDFIELGGHSLLAAKIISQVQQTFKIELPVYSLFEKPTIAQFSQQLEPAINLKDIPQRSLLESVSRAGEVPLSFSQEALWFLEQLEGQIASYNIVSAIHLVGQLHMSLLQQSITEILKRHEVLRTTFPINNRPIVQIVKPPSTISLPIIDWQQMPNGEQFSALQKLAKKEAHQKFNPTDGFLRITLLQLDRESHVLLWTMHHIISDGWSMEIFIRELTTLYSAFLKGEPSPLPELSIQYADFARWQRQRLTGEMLETQLKYWKQKLAASPPLLEFPSVRPRPPIQTFEGRREYFQINPDLAQKVKILGQTSGTTLFMTLLATFAILLSHYSNQDYLCIGFPIANRNYNQLDSLIGFFVNTLVLRIGLQDNLTVFEFLHQIRQVALDAYSHQELPFEKLVQEIQPERNLSYNPLFQVMFAWQNVPMQRVEIPELRVTPIEIETDTSMFDLSLMMEDTEEGLAGKFEYKTDLFVPATITRMVGHFQILLEQMVANPQQRISELSLLTYTEQHQLLVEWNHPQEKYSQEQFLHQLFESQVERTPEALAVVFGKQQLTYWELNHRANKIAHHLQVLGVKAESRVGVFLERSLEIVVGLLAILKAGGTYVPFDPSYPKDRLSFMLSDAQVSVLLTQEKLVPELPDYKLHLLCLDKDWHKIEQERSKNLVSPNSPNSSDLLAYIIYTSGSTGKPKGVLISHRAIVNHQIEIQKYYKLGIHDKVLQFASINFDASLEQIFSTLSVGATLVLRDQNIWTTIEFNQKLLKFGITTINLPPAYWQQLLQDWVEKPELFPRNNQLKLVIVGGDIFSPQLLKLWRRISMPSVRLLNAYGPTETTITATLFEITDEFDQDRTQQRIPIGRALPNKNTFILDPYGNPVPVGVPGELHIGGSGLARGYLNRPELTEEKFIPNPFSNEPGSRLYKTGDLALYLSDGNIEFLGRADRQVKIRGFRIDLNEIEVILSQHPSIQESVVLAVDRDSGKQKFINWKDIISLNRNAPTTLTEYALSIGQENVEKLLIEIESLSETEIDMILGNERELTPEQGKHIRRKFPEFDFNINFKDDQFICPPQESQRNWILQRAIDEFTDDLNHLNELSKHFITSSNRVIIQNEWRESQAHYDDTQLIIDGQQVMQNWQQPLMKVMANVVGETHGDVLEVGFGMGISATYIQECGVRSHTIIECNKDVIKNLNEWKDRYSNQDIRLLPKQWQDIVPQLEIYDGILFDTYPINEKEFVKYVINNITFAEHFFPVAASCLKKGGFFTYYTNEIDSFSRRHQRLLFQNFSSFNLSVVKPLYPPKDNVNWWADSMVVVKAIK